MFGDGDAGVVEFAVCQVVRGDVCGAGGEPDADRDSVADHGHGVCAAADGFVDDVEAFRYLLAALASGHASGGVGGPAEDELEEGFVNQ